MAERTEDPQTNPPTPSTDVPGISVLEEQVALIRIAKRQLQRLLAQEDSSAKYAREIRQITAHLAALLRDHVRTQQELGLVPAYLRSPRPTSASADGAGHQSGYAFVTAEEERAFKVIDGQLERGEVNVIEFYRAAGDLFKLEQERAARMRARS